jgi:hypothetical protein
MQLIPRKKKIGKNFSQKHLKFGQFFAPEIWQVRVLGQSIKLHSNLGT